MELIKKTISYVKNLSEVLGGWLFVIQWILIILIMSNFSNFLSLLYLTIVGSIKAVALIEMALSVIQGGRCYLPVNYFSKEKEIFYKSLVLFFNSGSFTKYCVLL